MSSLTSYFNFKNIFLNNSYEHATYIYIYISNGTGLIDLNLDSEMCVKWPKEVIALIID